MRIATFGSCLSRFTGNSLASLFGGMVVSSVYHNRSDVYAKRFVDKTISELNPDDILSKLKMVSNGVSLDNNGLKIVENQLRGTQGKHRLRRGVPFLHLLEKKGADVVIFDNYMDLSTKLMTFKGEAGESEWFLRPDDLNDPSEACLGEFLTPEVGVESMAKIMAFVRMKMPAAHLVFVNFPHNTYHASPERVLRTKRYEELMIKQADDSIFVIPCLDIPLKLQTHERQHYKPEMYCGYAGIVWNHINRKA